jgi:hypothetical protein
MYTLSLHDALPISVTLTLNDRAQYIIALVLSSTTHTPTTAQGSALLIQVSSNSINKPAQTFLSGPYFTSAPATNESGFGMIQDIIPLGWAAGPNAVLSFQTAPTYTTTTALTTMVGVIYADGTPPADWMSKFPDVMGANGAVSTSARQLTVARTALPALTIPKWAKAVVGFRVVDLKEGAITASEELHAIVDFQFSQAGVQPQIIPSNSMSGTLGTPVGAGYYHDWIPAIPAWIPLSGTGDITVTPYVTLQTAVSTGNNISVEILYK